MSDNLTLHDLIPGWPADGPSDLSEVLFLTDEAISELGDRRETESVRQLRTQVRRAALSWGRSAQLSSPEQVERCLTNGDLRLISRRWLTLALDRNRRRSFVAFSADSARTVEKLSKWVPDPDKLPTLPADGTYLILFGGSPDILEIDDVRERLRLLQKEVPVADVLFRHLEPGRSTLYSLRQGFGVRNNNRLDFPDPSLAEDASLWSPARGQVPMTQGGHDAL